MEIDKLHIAEADFDFFLTLNDKEKIGFLYDANEIGLEPTITKYISKRAHDTKPPENRLNDLFQDTYHDDMHTDAGRIIITTMNNYIHMNSNSLKLIRQFIFKLFDDGHIMMRHKNAKKIDGIDTLKYYRCYEIIGSGDPFCPN